MIATGRVIAWWAGPPCRTVSIARYRDDNGPPPLRARDGDQRFGLDGLTARQKERTDHDTALWIKNLWLMRIAHLFNPGMQFALEQPQDPNEWVSADRIPDGGFPTYLTWPETQVTMKRLKLEAVRLDQGSFGHMSTKPTTLDLDERIIQTKRLASWAPGIADALIAAVQRKIGEDPRLQALTAKQNQEAALWAEHYRHGHTPYRRDCEVCLESMGRDRPRRKIPTPDAHCLSLDVAGPFQPGFDQETGNPKYFLVGVATIPTQDGHPLASSLQKLGIQWPEPGEEPEPDQEHP